MRWTSEELEVEAARFIRWHWRKGGDKDANLAEWCRGRSINNADAGLIDRVVANALLGDSDDVLAWVNRTLGDAA